MKIFKYLMFKTSKLHLFTKPAKVNSINIFVEARKSGTPIYSTLLTDFKMCLIFNFLFLIHPIKNHLHYT